MATIVIIDDEEMVRFGVNYLLRSETRHRIIGEAGNGKEGLQLIRRLHPEIAFVDIRMPNMSGLELARMVRDEGLGCKIIILSAYSEFNYATEALRCGVVDYLTKPLEKEELVAALDRADVAAAPESAAPSPLLEASRQLLSGLLTGNDRLPPLVYRAIVYVSERFDQELSVDGIASQFRVSSAYLSRLFTQSMGISLSRFINEFRVSIAQSLLERPGYTISEIALMTGYNSPQYFCKMFKEVTLQTPQEYLREQMKRN